MGYTQLLGSGSPSFSPDRIANIYAWYRGDKGITLNGGSVSVWADQVPVAQNFNQNSASTQPAFNSSDSALKNRQSLTFDGSKFLDSSDSTLASDWKFLHDGSGCTIALVVYPTSNTGVTANTILDTCSIDLNNVGISLYRIPDSGNLRFIIVKGAGVYVLNLTGAGSLPYQQRVVITIRYEEGRPGNEYSLRVNGSSIISGNSANSPSASDASGVLRFGTTINKTLYGSFRSTELALYRRYITDTEVTRLENYMMGRY